MSTLKSAGETPLMRLACPSVAGLTLSNFWRASILNDVRRAYSISISSGTSSRRESLSAVSRSFWI